MSSSVQPMQTPKSERKNDDDKLYMECIVKYMGTIYGMHGKIISAWNN